MPEGRVTRGTTGTNRLRRVDRWLAAHPAFLRAGTPLVVDLGYGAAPWTAAELFDRLRKVRADTRVVGIEIDPDRVAAAEPYARPGLEFRLGGFELPLEGGRFPDIVRAMNVLRQYEEEEVPGAWRRMTGRLSPSGLLVDGTSNEVGRVASWIGVTAAGPETLTMSVRVADLERPGIVAERLPKVLIHRNVPGERIHSLLADLDRFWAHTAGYAEFGAVQRWTETIARLAAAGWTVRTPPRRLRLGELTVPWPEVAPLDFAW